MKEMKEKDCKDPLFSIYYVITSNELKREYPSKALSTS